jgi:hypothetical protein
MKSLISSQRLVCSLSGKWNATLVLTPLSFKANNLHGLPRWRCERLYTELPRKDALRIQAQKMKSRAHSLSRFTPLQSARGPAFWRNRKHDCFVNPSPSPPIHRSQEQKIRRRSSRSWSWLHRGTTLAMPVQSIQKMATAIAPYLEGLRSR